tara:strand:+ start:158 stop:493 length:336 start_codon:yes stop_codon:yes gene_type:complete
MENHKTKFCRTCINQGVIKEIDYNEFIGKNLYEIETRNLCSFVQFTIDENDIITNIKDNCRYAHNRKEYRGTKKAIGCQIPKKDTECINWNYFCSSPVNINEFTRESPEVY